MNQARDFDVIVIGGGPSGATAALCLARAGVRVAVVEKAAFPRFQIGESFLPYNFEMLRELGLLDRLRVLPHMRKLGGEFGFGDTDKTSLFHFKKGMLGGASETFNIARADFDKLLLDAASEAGAKIHQPAIVKRIDNLADGDVRITTDAGPMSARYLLDASGAATVVGRHLGIRRTLDDPHLRKVAYFGHFTGVERLPGEMAGYPTVVMCDEGWFWLIPLDETRTSVGLVLDPAVAQSVGVPPREMLAWAIERCPLVKKRMAGAQGDAVNMVRADFSYRCDPVAGPGYFLLGDAAVFLDPVFSTGVCLGMAHGRYIAEQLVAVLQQQRSPRAAQRAYMRYVAGSSKWFIKLIRFYYDHAFRELFLHGQGPLQVHAAIVAVLTGHVFPRPVFAVRWRLALFELVLRLHRKRALVPRHEHCSLLAGPADDAVVQTEAAASARA